MKKILFSFILFLFPILSFSQTEKNGDFSFIYQIGYSCSQGSAFNMSMAMKKTWGIFVNYGGFGPERSFETGIDYNYNTEVISNEKDKNNKWSIVVGPTFRVLKKIPLYISAGVGYGTDQEIWQRYEKYNFEYVSDEYNLVSYEKSKKTGINYQIGLEYDFIMKSWMIGVESYYNKYMGVGLGVVFGINLGEMKNY